MLINTLGFGLDLTWWQEIGLYTLLFGGVVGAGFLLFGIVLFCLRRGRKGVSKRLWVTSIILGLVLILGPITWTAYYDYQERLNDKLASAEEEQLRDNLSFQVYAPSSDAYELASYMREDSVEKSAEDVPYVEFSYDRSELTISQYKAEVSTSNCPPPPPNGRTIQECLTVGTTHNGSHVIRADAFYDRLYISDINGTRIVISFEYDPHPESGQSALLSDQDAIDIFNSLHPISKNEIKLRNPVE